MNQLREKRPRLKLDSKSYRKLCQRVVQRDGWRCQNCGSRENLQVHHIRKRSNLGNDAKANLITLCAGCHQTIHGNPS